METVLQFLGMSIAFIVAFWVFVDAKIKGKTTGKAFLWFLGVFFALILFLPLWLITRPKVKLCRYCGEYYEYEESDAFCSECGVELQSEE